MEVIAKILGFIILVIGGMMMSAYVFVQLWEWFIVPIFGANPLRLVEAMGIAVFIGFLKFKKSDLNPDPDDEGKDFWLVFGKSLGFLMLYYGFVLILGSIVKSFM